MKDGRKPIAEKGKANPFRKAGGGAGSLTDIDPAFKEAAKKAGYELRWLNQKTLIENQGFHRRMWEPVKRNRFGEIPGSSTANLSYGESPDGFIRRGTMILGYRSKELSDQHREMLKEDRDAYARILPEAAEKLRESARQHGVETKISDRYDDN